MRIATLLFLLSACAPAASSLPSVRIDRSLSGAVVSREAAETIAVLRERERGWWAKQLEDERERVKTAQARENAAAWWRDNAPWVVIGASVLGIAGGFVLGSQIGNGK